MSKYFIGLMSGTSADSIDGCVVDFSDGFKLIHSKSKDLEENYKPKYDWQKSHKNNMTGTNEAYYPSNHPLSKDFKLNEEQEDYESWSP